MISQIYWLVPKHVLYWKISGQIPASEIVEMSDFIAEQLANSGHRKVHLVINTTGIQEIEYNSWEAEDAFERLAKKQWIGKVVAISHNLKIQMHLNKLNRAFGSNWYNASTMDDAIRYLKNADSLLQAVPKLLENPPIVRPITSYRSETDRPA
jgi:hypothetical protein